MEPVLLRIQETAKLLNVSKWTVYRWIEEGRLQGTKIGKGSLRVFRQSVHALIDGAKGSHASFDEEKHEHPRQGKTQVRNKPSRSPKK